MSMITVNILEMLLTTIIQNGIKMYCQLTEEVTSDVPQGNFLERFLLNVSTILLVKVQTLTTVQ